MNISAVWQKSKKEDETTDVKKKAPIGVKSSQNTEKMLVSSI